MVDGGGPWSKLCFNELTQVELTRNRLDQLKTYSRLSCCRGPGTNSSINKLTESLGLALSLKQERSQEKTN